MIKLFQNLSLSCRTVSACISDMAQDIEKSLQDSAANFEFYSLAMDETTDLMNTSQLAIFLCGIPTDFEICFRCKAMHDTTRGTGVHAARDH